MTAVIAGIGELRTRRREPASEHALGVRAIAAALREAGLPIDAVDGVVRFDREAAWEYDLPGVLRIPRLDWYAAVPFGPGSVPAMVGLAAMAVREGRATVVVGWHARDGVARSSEPPGPLAPFALVGTREVAAVVLRRWQHERRVRDTALAAATCALRARAVHDPRALVRRALARSERARSPVVAAPLRAVDCAPPAIGAGAFVVTTAERARRARCLPVPVLDWIQVGVPSATRDPMSWFARSTQRAMRWTARGLWRRSGVRPAEVDVACVFADPGPLALLGLEIWGIAAPGVWPRRPCVNPHGGALVGGNLDGINDLLEAVRQIRGDAALQVPHARLALVAGSPLEPTSTVLLGQPRLAARASEPRGSRRTASALSPRWPRGAR